MAAAQDAPFSSASSSTVRSIKQRDLLNVWLRLYSRSGEIPRIGDFKPDRMSDELMDIVFCSVEGNADNPRIMIDSDGTAIASAYGKHGRGQLLQDYLGPTLGQIALPIYRECIRRRLPVYTVSTVVDLHGRHVDYERLLLPFSEGGRVDRLIASLKAISEEGGFEMRNLMRANKITTDFVVRCVIDQTQVQRAGGRAAPGDVIEFI